MQNILLRKAIRTTTIAALLLGGTAFHHLHADEPQSAFMPLSESHIGFQTDFMGSNKIHEYPFK